MLDRTAGRTTRRRSIRGLMAGITVCLAFVLMPSGAGALDFRLAPDGPISVGESSPRTGLNEFTAGDFNGDGVDDLAASGPSNGVFVWLADGDGGFAAAPSSPFATGVSHRAIHAADFNGDGKIDLVTGAAEAPYTFRTYLGEGTGEFDSVPDHEFVMPDQMGILYNSTSLGDLNGDSRPDLFAGTFHRQFSIALGNVDGSFSLTPGSPITVPKAGVSSQYDSVGGVAVGDYDGDGKNDLAVAVRTNEWTDPDAGVYVAKGDGTGAVTFTTGNPRVPGKQIRSIATADLDGTGPDDLSVIVASFTKNVTTLIGSDDSLVANPNPAGTLTAGTDTWGHMQAIADFDEDGNQDVASSLSKDVMVARGDGTGGLSLPTDGIFALPDIAGVRANTNDFATGDFNGDGYADVAALSGDSFDEAFARGIYPLINSPQVGAEPSKLKFGDVATGASRTLDLTLSNTGGPPATLSTITITGPDADLFSVEDPAACKAVLQAGDGCELEFTYAPDGPDATAATATISFEDAAAVTVPLTGDKQVPAASIDRDSIDLGLQNNVNDVISGGGFTLTSSGSADLEVSSVELTGSDPGSFYLYPGECETTLPPGHSCHVVVYHSTSSPPGVRSAEIRVNSNDPAGPIVVPVTMEYRIYAIEISPKSQDFGAAEIGSTGGRPVRTFTITSKSSVPYEPGVWVEDDPWGSGDPGFEILSDTCNEALSPGQSCQARVAFNPVSGQPGERKGWLVSGPGMLPKRVPLTGTAVAKTYPDLRFKLTAPKRARPGALIMVKVATSNVGDGSSGPITLATSVPSKLAKRPRKVKVSMIPAGRKVTHNIPIRVRRRARPGAVLKVLVTATHDGTKAAVMNRTVRIKKN